MRPSRSRTRPSTRGVSHGSGSTGPRPRTPSRERCWYCWTRRSAAPRPTMRCAEEALAERKPGPGQHPTFSINGATRQAVAEKTYLQEWHYFFENPRRWRDLRKITIAQVQGSAISAALMLIWACDLIVAAAQAKIAQVVGV